VKNSIAGETYGTVDELNAALGMAARAGRLPLVKRNCGSSKSSWSPLMANWPVAPEDAQRYAKDKYPKLTPEMLQHLDNLVAKIEKEKITFEGWARRARASLPPRSMSPGRCAAARSGWWRNWHLERDRFSRHPYLNRLWICSG